MDKDSLIHIPAAQIIELHDNILEHLSGLKGIRPGMSVDALTGRILNSLAYQAFHDIAEVANIKRPCI